MVNEILEQVKEDKEVEVLHYLLRIAADFAQTKKMITKRRRTLDTNDNRV